MTSKTDAVAWRYRYRLVATHKWSKWEFISEEENDKLQRMLRDELTTPELCEVESLYSTPPPQPTPADSTTDKLARALREFSDDDNCPNRRHSDGDLRCPEIEHFRSDWCMWCTARAALAEYEQGAADLSAVRETFNRMCGKDLSADEVRYFVNLLPSRPPDVRGASAVTELPDKWRKEAEQFGDTCMSDGTGGALESCADELEAALAASKGEGHD